MLEDFLERTEFKDYKDFFENYKQASEKSSSGVFAPELLLYIYGFQFAER